MCMLLFSDGGKVEQASAHQVSAISLYGICLYSNISLDLSDYHSIYRYVNMLNYILEGGGGMTQVRALGHHQDTIDIDLYIDWSVLNVCIIIYRFVWISVCLYCCMFICL